MYLYYFKAAKNYKNIFKLMCVVEIKHFNNCLYFYYINNKINSLTIIVDLNKCLLLLKKDKVI